MDMTRPCIPKQRVPIVLFVPLEPVVPSKNMANIIGRKQVLASGGQIEMVHVVLWWWQKGSPVTGKPLDTNIYSYDNLDGW